MRVALPLFVLALSVAGAWRAERLWRADRLGPGGGALLFPQSSAGQIGAGNFDLALAINPGLAQAWIGKGLDAEMAGDLDAAGRFLLAAERVSRMSLPRWTLANFHARRGDMDSFWIWARRTVDVVYSDPAPVFHLAWQLTDDAGRISDRLIASDPTQRRYLHFLLTTNRVVAAGPVAIRLARNASHTDAGILLTASDRLIAAERIEDARQVWNRLGATGLHPHGQLDDARPLTNGGFLHPPIGHGFDWTLSPDPTLSIYTTGGEAVVAFSGNQPESMDVMWQYLPLRAGSRFLLRFEYRTERALTGPQWRFAETDLDDQPPSESWREASLPLLGRMGRLVLHTRRRPGTTRPEGSMRLRKVRLEPAP